MRLRKDEFCFGATIIIAIIIIAATIYVVGSFAEAERAGPKQQLLSQYVNERYGKQLEATKITTIRTRSSGYVGHDFWVEASYLDHASSRFKVARDAPGFLSIEIRKCPSQILSAFCGLDSSGYVVRGKINREGWMPKQVTDFVREGVTVAITQTEVKRETRRQHEAAWAKAEGLQAANLE